MHSKVTDLQSEFNDRLGADLARVLLDYCNEAERLGIPVEAYLAAAMAHLAGQFSRIAIGIGISRDSFMRQMGGVFDVTKQFNDEEAAAGART
jgi:hypothetical protein